MVNGKWTALHRYDKIHKVSLFQV